MPHRGQEPRKEGKGPRTAASSTAPFPDSAINVMNGNKEDHDYDDAALLHAEFENQRDNDADGQQGARRKEARRKQESPYRA